MTARSYQRGVSLTPSLIGCVRRSSVTRMQVTKRVLGAVTALWFAIGVAVATATPGPLLFADDVAYLSMARTLAGEGSSAMPAQPPYGFLYPALLAPGWLLGFDEGGMLAYARAVNAALGALLVPVLYVIVRRVWSTERLPALLAAMAGAALPALWLTGSIVWTERLLALLVAVAFLTIIRLAASRTPDRALQAIVAAVGLFATHPRMGPTALVVIIFAALITRRSTIVRVGLLSAGVIALGLTEWVRRVIADATFGNSGTYDAGDLASRRGIGEIPDMAQHALGTGAYLTLAGTGILLIGLVMTVRRPIVGPALLGMFGATVAVAGWFLTGVGRSDAWLHGRYVEVFAPVLLALGLASLKHMSWKPALGLVVAAPIAAGIIGAWAGPGNNWNTPRSPVMMLGVEVSGAPFGSSVFEPGAAASVSILVGLVLWRLWRLDRQIIATVVLSGVVALGVASGLEGLDKLYDGNISGRTSGVFDDVEAVGELYVDTERVSPNLIAALAWEVGFDDTTKLRTSATTHLLLAPDAPPPAGATLVLQLESGTVWALR